ncbi:hypothetical protein LO771_21470 [Streptacidiphilus sp. ASG 303]|uniref:hypothetical protein n=1 Tax=Streptacidiphilus sp. ASG 303 TaxID=2896847 RepID=UPI001E3A575F|nr:hypothetical protein [Streptacidiphilus sp. ASG 303]MCD0484890.1 hypothetical protein [Streptacidiphilus sp. ASG 303]
MVKHRTKSRRTASVAAMCAAAAATVVLASAPATAASTWWSDPNSCTGAATATERTVSGRQVQVRYGMCGGSQYGWGRILNYGSSDYIRFEVSLGGHVWDYADIKLAGSRNYTQGYLTSSSSAVAFRACYVTSILGTCTSTNSTSWW